MSRMSPRSSSLLSNSKMIRSSPRRVAVHYIAARHVNVGLAPSQVEKLQKYPTSETALAAIIC